MRRFGVADNGDVVAVVAADGDADACVVEAWPPLGLAMRGGRRADGDDGEDADMFDEADGVDPAGRVVATVVVSGSAGRDGVESELALFAAERLAGLVAVHAGVLVVDGRAVLLPGVSHAGKSTLCSAALDAGVEVWSDEFALVDADGRVRGWRRPVRVRTGGGVVRRPLPPPRTEAPVEVAGVACVVFDRAAVRTELVECDRLDAMSDVLMNTVCARTRPVESFEAARAVTSDAVLLRGTRADATEALHVLLERLARSC